MHGVPRPSGTSYCILLSTCHPLHPRAEAVANGKHCFRCLCRKYFSSACKKTAKCNVTDCSQWHHPLLHESGRVFPCRTGNAVAPIEWLYINFPVLVAIVLIWVIVHNGAFRTLGMLDPGSKITLMRKDFAENIGVLGPPYAFHLVSCLDSQLLQIQNPPDLINSILYFFNR